LWLHFEPHPGPFTGWIRREVSHLKQSSQKFDQLIYIILSTREAQTGVLIAIGWLARPLYAIAHMNVHQVIL
jgi:hypothetical protein